MIDWLVLTASLPTSPSGLRVRIWRALKATGCAALRDGVYILPSTARSSEDLWRAEQAIRSGGAEAHMLKLKARDEVQEQEFVSLFDRTEQYADFAHALKEARKALRSSTEADLRATLRRIDQQLRSIDATDFFPGKAAAAARTGLDALRGEVERSLSPGEPKASSRTIDALSSAAFQGRTWATRKRPWVDRLATAWLIQRFIDAEPRFIWLADAKRCPKSAVGFDFDGARFSHVGDQVTFEVVAQSFGLHADAGIRRLGQLVHYIDIGGIPVEEAAGLEAMVRGLQSQHAKDDSLLEAACVLFDTLYVALKASS